MSYALPENLAAGFLDRIAHLSRIRITSTPAPDLGTGGLRYEIVGESRDDVQREVARLMGQVDEFGGSGGFEGPSKVRAEGVNWGKFAATGYTIIRAPSMQAAE